MIKSTKMAQVAAPVDVEKCSNDVHMLVVPYPARGHNLVCIQLARKFLPYGVRVTLANIFDNLSPDLLHVCQTENITVANLGVCPADPGPGNLPFMGDVESVQGETEQLVANFASGTDSLPVTCIVGDILLGWTQNVADKFGIPRYVICTSRAGFLAAFLHMPTLAGQGIVPVQPPEASELVDIPGLPPTRRGDLSPAVQASSLFCKYFFAQYVHRCCQPALEAAGYFINSFYELEPSCIDLLRSFPYEHENSKGSSPVRSFFPVGPLVHDEYLQLLRLEVAEGSSFVEPGAPYLRWLDRQPTDSVLYVNFGSIVSLSKRQIHELALGLEASKQRFLLVVRPSTVKDSDEDLPLLPESFKAHTLETGFVQSQWVNQLDVLSHPAVGGFLTHCGWNSTLESICRGVPLLAWPFQADQMLNCRFLVDEAKTAVEVRKGENGFVSREEVARAARELMAEPEGDAVKENVRKLREKVKKAVCEADGSVQKSVENFLAELKTSRRDCPTSPSNMTTRGRLIDKSSILKHNLVQTGSPMGA
ncbi:hypothetical protein KC19_5G068000 [Ceratodon purpureus]|uniref:Glycosyltransferase n=3 Tax=Ceratodon purpureus TaxID=3225 RepID=A0A8T0I049_CERPU|nr:hypothetical protein KC19_5G068000 [Ceratodon purpureus]